MWLGALLLLLAAFAFASAGLYYLAAILVLIGKLVGALVVGFVGGMRLFVGATITLLKWASYLLACIGGFVWGFLQIAAREGDAATGRAHRAGMVTIEWLKRAYVKREKRGRGL